MRSSTPPWPGIRPDESFTPALRFSSDSNRSPTMPSATIVAPTQHEHRQAGRRKHAAGRRAPSPPLPSTTPPIAPSTVFFGLIAGASGWRPNARPRVVLRRIADDDRRPPAAATASAPADAAHGRQRAERQADVEHRKQRRRRVARIARAWVRRARPRARRRRRARSAGRRRAASAAAADGGAGGQHRGARQRPAARARRAPRRAPRTPRTPAARRPSASTSVPIGGRNQTVADDDRQQDGALRTRVTVAGRLATGHRPATAGCLMPP